MQEEDKSKESTSSFQFKDGDLLEREYNTPKEPIGLLAEIKNNLNSLLGTGQQMLSEGQYIEAVLSFLRNNGCSKIDSIKAVRSLKQVTLGEAKEIVHFSKTWQDRSKDDEAFHDSLEKALDQLEQTQ